MKFENPARPRQRLIARVLACVLRCGFSFLILLHVAVSQGQVPSADSTSALLTNAQQIAALGTNFTSGTQTARLSVVVLYVSGTRRLYVQDGELGVQVNLSEATTGIHVGHRVEVTGTVLGGNPLLRLGNARATVLSEGVLPEPKLVSAHRLVRGRDPFRYVAVRGFVRDMVSTRNAMTLLLTDGAFPFEVIIQSSPPALPREWFDSEIEVRGLSYPNFSDGTATGFRFHASDTNCVRVLSAGIADRFDGRPLMTIAEAAEHPKGWNSRIRIAGTFTGYRPDGPIFLDDGTGAMVVEMLGLLPVPAGGQHLGREPWTRLQPGDRIEVIGARHNWFSLTPTLITAEYRRVGNGPPVRPVKVSFRDLQKGRHVGRVVEFTALLLNQRGWSSANLMNYQWLTFRVDDEVFQARWQSEKPANWELKPDSYYRITGVNDAETSGKRITFQILLRSPEDVVPGTAPPFWTLKEFQRLALAGGSVGLVAGVLIVFQLWQMRRLERRVADRTAELARVAALASASEARTRSIVDTALDAVISMDAAGRITAWNTRAEAIFGWPAAEVLGRLLADTIIPPSHREAHRRGLERYVATGEGPVLNRRIEVTALRRDGSEFPAELSIAPLQIGGAPHFSAFLRDITDRKLAETRLRDSEERFSKAFHGSNARLAILDAGTGRYLDVNEAFVEAYGYTREEVLGRTSLELKLWEDPAQREEAYRIYERDGRLRDFESRVRTRCGEVKVVLQSGDFVSVGDRRCILSVGIDITGHKRVEAELLQNYAREKELSELKSRFVAMVSHEFRTPLAIITSSAEILDAYLDRLSSDERKSNIRDVTDAARHMSRMMEEVLLLGSVEAGKLACRPAPLDLAAFGRRLIDEVASATNSRCPIHFTAAPALAQAQADEGLLRHIFTNLLNNASKYSAAGSAVEFQLEASGHLALFTVRDRGIGIPEADARLLFQAFHRGRNVGDTPGTGLGMTIVKRCVELHGGKIAFESKEGYGTTFIVALPLFGTAPGGNGEGASQFLRAAINGKNLTVIS